MTSEITAIEPFPKGKGRYGIYLNDEFAFVLYKGELSKYDLKVGRQMDDELYERIVCETLNPRARKRGMNLLMKMDRTEADIRKKLTDSGYPAVSVDDAVAFLISHKYVDDLRYACEYIRAKSSSASRRQIEMKLFEKGIKKETVAEAFLRYEEENGEDSEETEKALIAKLIRKRFPLGIDDIDYRDKQKLYAFLYNKGFSIAAIDDAMSYVSEKH